MKLSSLLENVKVKNEYPDREISFITDDSRKIAEGCAFVCIKGNKFDGHSAAREAVEKGAAAVICEYSLGLSEEIVTENTRKAFSLMCSSFFGNPSAELKLIGITGTNGKTTTTFLVKEMLELLGKKCGLIGTVVNMVGDKSYPSSLTTPESFALNSLFREMADAGCEYCVMEVSSQALAQGRVEGCEFETAVFTNLTQDHLDYHGNFENYAAAKAILFGQCKKAVLNRDDAARSLMIKNSDCDRIFYAEKNDADYRASNITYKPTGIEYDLSCGDEKYRVCLGIPGEFSVYNSMAAVSAAAALGFGPDKTVPLLPKLRGVKGRIEVVPTDTDYVVIIDYAHSPDGLENILHAVRPITEGRVLTVFGCGGDRDKTKRPIMGRVAAELSDKIFVTSDNPRTEDPDAIIEDILAGLDGSDTPRFVNSSRTEAIRQALSEATAGDTVLLAGKGHETYQILGTEKIHYDEREIVKGILDGSL